MHGILVIVFLLLSSISLESMDRGRYSMKDWKGYDLSRKCADRLLCMFALLMCRW